MTNNNPLFADQVEQPLIQAEELDFAKTANLIYAVRKQEAEIDTIKQQKKEAAEFYDARIRSIENNIAYLKGQIEGYLRVVGEKKLATHLGTAFFQTRIVTQWPATEELSEFASEHGIPDSFETVVKPAVVKEWCKKNSIRPTGYNEETVTSLVIRDPSSRGGNNGDY